MPSIDVGQFVRVGGIAQWLAIRGDDVRNPALFIIGGAGAALSAMAPFFGPWEQSFTIVHWDQPGAGATYANDPGANPKPLSIARLVEDGAAIIDAARQIIGAKRIAVMGYSAGSVVGLYIAKQRADLITAFVGTGQFVHWRRQDALSYQIVLKRARAQADAAAVAELGRIGPPPYPDAAADAVKSRYATALTPAEQQEFAQLDDQTAAALRQPPPGARYAPEGLPRHDVRGLALAAYEDLRGELTTFDAASLGKHFETPLFFFLGAEDAYAVTSEVEVYADSVVAPSKRIELIENGGHSALFLRTAMGKLLDEHIRPLGL